MSDADLDLSLSPVKKNVARQGRRAGENSWGDGEDDGPKDSWTEIGPSSGQDELFATSTKTKSEGGRRRTGGWASSRNNSLTQKSSIEKSDVSEEEDLPIIPDLEEVEREDMAQRIADAPNVAVNRVDTYKELDSDLFKHAAFATLEEIDLRLLTRHMVPEHSLKEPDEVWTWDKLFADVSSQIQSEWFPINNNQVRDTKAEQENNERPYTAFNKFPV